MQRIAQGTLERISGKSPVHLHVLDRRLDRAASMDHGLQTSRDSPLLTRHQDAHPFDLDAPVTPVHHCRVRLAVGAREDAHLLQGFCQCVSVVRIARHGAHAHHQRFLVRGGNAHRHAELVRGAGLALGDALELRGVQGIQIVFVLGAREYVSDLDPR